MDNNWNMMWNLLIIVLAPAASKACLKALNSRRTYVTFSNCSRKGSLMSLPQGWKLKTVRFWKDLHYLTWQDPTGWNAIMYWRFEFVSWLTSWHELSLLTGCLNTFAFLWLQKFSSTGGSLTGRGPNAITSNNLVIMKRSHDSQSQNFPGSKIFSAVIVLYEINLVKLDWRLDDDIWILNWKQCSSGIMTSKM